jgi:hypothetical protein
MNYFQPYAVSGEEAILAAWDSVSEIKENLAERSRSDLFPTFAHVYAELQSLPRGARRVLQRKLAASRDLAIPAASRRRLAASVAGAALLLALGQGAHAATITVNTNIAKLVPGDLKCSLVEAILNAETDSDHSNGDCVIGNGADTIVLPPASAHVVPGIYDTTYGSRLPLITSTITIQGNGGKIQGTKKGGAARLIAVHSSGNLTLQNMTLSGGNAAYGGAIINYGSLTVTNSVITGNSATKGGGIYNASGGELEIEHSTFSKNAAINGAGVYNSSGIVDVDDTDFIGNKTFYSGAGFYNGAGTATIQNSIFSGNKGGTGPGIYNNGGSLTITSSIISRNSAVRGGGGIMSVNFSNTPGCSLSIENSTVSLNSAHSEGGILSQACDFILRDSTVSANKSSIGAGGVWVSFAPALIENSTITGNKGAFAGGIFSQRSLTVSNSTITGNISKKGGGIYNGNGEIILKRSIVSGNKAAVGPEIYKPSHYSVVVTVDNYNVLGTSGDPGVVNFSPGISDIVPSGAITTILSPLADNGGPTLSHALVTGSPAIDASPHDADCPSEDQRGITRPQGAACDIGAFEKQ